MARSTKLLLSLSLLLLPAFASAASLTGKTWVLTLCGDGKLYTAGCPAGGPAVGDGYIDYAVEECEDGNASNGDGCSSLGLVESGFASRFLVPSCGNNIVEGIEECDGGLHCSSCTLDLEIAQTVNVSSCQALTQTKTRYVLTQDINSSAATDCFIIQADDIEFDGGGFEINTTQGRAVYVEEYNNDGVEIHNFKATTTAADNLVAGRGTDYTYIHDVWLSNRTDTDTDTHGNVINFFEGNQLVVARAFLENHKTGNGNRGQYSGATVKTKYNTVVRDTIFKGTPQNFVAMEGDVHIFNTFGNGGTEIEPGDLSTSYTNNFAMVGYNVSDSTVNNNVVNNGGPWSQSYTLQGTSLAGYIDIDLPYLLGYHIGANVKTLRPLKIIDGDPQNRGLFGVDGVGDAGGNLIYNNYQANYVKPNNPEYAGGSTNSCQLGGSTGIQVECDVDANASCTHSDTIVHRNQVVSIAADCDANGLKPSAVKLGGSADNIWEHNDSLAIKMPPFEPLGGLGIAHNVSIRASVPGIVFQDNTLRTMQVDGNMNVVTTGSDYLMLWRLGDAFGTDGFTFLNTLVEIAPNSTHLSGSKVWNGTDEVPPVQTITWDGTSFANGQSSTDFTADIGTVYDVWDIWLDRALPHSEYQNPGGSPANVTLTVQ